MFTTAAPGRQFQHTAYILELHRLCITGIVARWSTYKLATAAAFAVTAPTPAIQLFILTLFVAVQVTAYSYATILLPSLVLAPEYFQGKIPFGTLTQVRQAAL